MASELSDESYEVTDSLLLLSKHIFIREKGRGAAILLTSRMPSAINSATSVKTG